MDTLQIIILALVQGLTEFLPISSSAHLILVSQLSGWGDEGLALDVATHLGTLIAVVFYFRKDLQALLLAWVKPDTASVAERRMGLMILIGTIPALAIGWWSADMVEANLRRMEVIAWATIGFGLLLWVADRWGGTRYQLKDINPLKALLVGFAQALALIPGTSRAGITITAGRFLGLSRQAAARFSFLLSIPIIAAAGSYGALQIWQGETSTSVTDFILAASVSAVAGFVCIWAFLRLLDKIGMTPFVIYRLILGVILLAII